MQNGKWQQQLRYMGRGLIDLSKFKKQTDTPLTLPGYLCLKKKGGGREEGWEQGVLLGCVT